MNDHFKTIYTHHAPQYERLIACEDVDGRLLPTLQTIQPLSKQTTVVEWGAGTGRLTCLLAPHVKQILAFDESAAMLAVAQRKLQATGWRNWQLTPADHQIIPLPDNCADVGLEGWAFAHYVGWQPADWRQALTLALAEMARIVRPGGKLILLETLGTGFTTPTPPPNLRPLYAWLQQEQGFSHTWLRTDYGFATLAEAQELLAFFFGEALAAQASPANYRQFPECTGIWHKSV